MLEVTYEPRHYIDPKLKKNKLWWFGNIDDPRPPDGYLRGKPEWFRIMCWYIRNPMHNYNHYVKGVGDKNRTVRGDYPYEKWNPNGEYNRLITIVHEDGRELPFESHRPYKHWLFRKNWERYEGWGPKGDYGRASRKSKATNAGDM